MATKTQGSQKGQEPTPAADSESIVKRFSRYVEDSRAELRKVTWPTVSETRQGTLAVLGFVAVMAIILGLVDLGLSSIIKGFLS